MMWYKSTVDPYADPPPDPAREGWFARLLRKIREAWIDYLGAGGK